MCDCVPYVLTSIIFTPQLIQQAWMLNRIKVTSHSMQKTYYMSQYCTGGATNKALRNKTGSSRGRAKRGRGRGGSSGATTRGIYFERYLHGSVNYGNECNYVSAYFLI